MKTESANGLDLSVFFFSSDGTKDEREKYDLVLDCAHVADQEGFAAVWTPERHFNRFGGLYPNPAVLGAAIAAQTTHVGIRAGSVVLPLHHPVRVAEEWAVVDNISNGRVAVAFASGYHEVDFVLQPDVYADRREHMERNIDVVRRLWRGERLVLTEPSGKPVEVATYPRPLQRELPVWIAAGSRQTWQRAARLGANILCLLGTSPAIMSQMIQQYRSARQEHGHDAASGRVTVMVHTYVDVDLEQAREKTREPLMRYLRDFVDQSQFVRGDAMQREEELLELAYERRFAQTSLIGPPSKCCRLLDQLWEAGVNEVACLVDFGVDKPDVIASMGRLAQIRQRYCH